MSQSVRAGLLTLVVIIFTAFLGYALKIKPSASKSDLDHPPQALLVKAVHMNHGLAQGLPHAIDFGIGEGSETLFLLKNGFKVTAIDSKKEVFKHLYQHLEGKPYFGRLKTISQNCQQVDWQHISTSDFFLASFALPFCSPQNFQHTWSHITQHIKPGGYFVGQFFDPRYRGLSWWQRRHMTFLTQEQVLELFKDFDIKYLSRKKEQHAGHHVQAEYYEVIAQKK